METLSFNIGNFSAEWGSLRNDNTTLADRISELMEQVTALAN